MYNKLNNGAIQFSMATGSTPRGLILKGGCFRTKKIDWGMVSLRGANSLLKANTPYKSSFTLKITQAGLRSIFFGTTPRLLGGAIFLSPSGGQYSWPNQNKVWAVIKAHEAGTDRVIQKLSALRGAIINSEPPNPFRVTLKGLEGSIWAFPFKRGFPKPFRVTLKGLGGLDILNGVSTPLSNKGYAPYIKGIGPNPFRVTLKGWVKNKPPFKIGAHPYFKGGVKYAELQKLLKGNKEAFKRAPIVSVLKRAQLNEINVTDKNISNFRENYYTVENFLYWKKPLNKPPLLQRFKGPRITPRVKNRKVSLIGFSKFTPPWGGLYGVPPYTDQLKMDPKKRTKNWINIKAFKKKILSKGTPLFKDPLSDTELTQGVINPSESEAGVQSRYLVNPSVPPGFINPLLPPPNNKGGGWYGVRAINPGRMLNNDRREEEGLDEWLEGLDEWLSFPSGGLEETNKTINPSKAGVKSLGFMDSAPMPLPTPFNPRAKPIRRKIEPVRDFNKPQALLELEATANVEEWVAEEWVEDVMTTALELEATANKEKFYTSYSKKNEIKYISIGLASPEKIKKWAEKTLPNGKMIGQVLNANTLHHKTFKPPKGGLFCERIFGPLKDFFCGCGKSSKMSNKNKMALRGANSLKEGQASKGKAHKLMDSSMTLLQGAEPVRGNKAQNYIDLLYKIQEEENYVLPELETKDKLLVKKGKDILNGVLFQKGDAAEGIGNNITPHGLGVAPMPLRAEPVRAGGTGAQSQEGFAPLKRTINNKFKHISNQFCPDCDIEYTWAISRRYQLGYIELALPVTHVWYLKGIPNNNMSILLGLKRRCLQSIAYCSEKITLENGLNKIQIERTPDQLVSSWQKSVKKTVIQEIVDSVSRRKGQTVSLHSIPTIKRDSIPPVNGPPFLNSGPVDNFNPVLLRGANSLLKTSFNILNGARLKGNKSITSKPGLYFKRGRFKGVLVKKDRAHKTVHDRWDTPTRFNKGSALKGIGGGVLSKKKSQLTGALNLSTPYYPPLIRKGGVGTGLIKPPLKIKKRLNVKRIKKVHSLQIVSLYFEFLKIRVPNIKNKQNSFPRLLEKFQINPPSPQPFRVTLKGLGPMPKGIALTPLGLGGEKIHLQPQGTNMGPTLKKGGFINPPGVINPFIPPPNKKGGGWSGVRAINPGRTLNKTKSEGETNTNGPFLNIKVSETSLIITSKLRLSSFKLFLNYFPMNSYILRNLEILVDQESFYLSNKLFYFFYKNFYVSPFTINYTPYWYSELNKSITFNKVSLLHTHSIDDILFNAPPFQSSPSMPLREPKEPVRVFNGQIPASKKKSKLRGAEPPLKLKKGRNLKVKGGFAPLNSLSPIGQNPPLTYEGGWNIGEALILMQSTYINKIMGLPMPLFFLGKDPAPNQTPPNALKGRALSKEAGGVRRTLKGSALTKVGLRGARLKKRVKESKGKALTQNTLMDHSLNTPYKSGSLSLSLGKKEVTPGSPQKKMAHSLKEWPITKYNQFLKNYSFFKKKGWFPSSLQIYNILLRGALNLLWPPLHLILGGVSTPLSNKGYAPYIKGIGPNPFRVTLKGWVKNKPPFKSAFKYGVTNLNFNQTVLTAYPQGVFGFMGKAHNAQKSLTLKGECSNSILKFNRLFITLIIGGNKSSDSHLQNFLSIWFVCTQGLYGLINFQRTFKSGPQPRITLNGQSPLNEYRLSNIPLENGGSAPFDSIFFVKLKTSGNALYTRVLGRGIFGEVLFKTLNEGGNKTAFISSFKGGAFIAPLRKSLIVFLNKLSAAVSFVYSTLKRGSNPLLPPPKVHDKKGGGWYGINNPKIESTGPIISLLNFSVTPGGLLNSVKILDWRHTCYQYKKQFVFFFYSLQNSKYLFKNIRNNNYCFSYRERWFDVDADDEDDKEWPLFSWYFNPENNLLNTPIPFYNHLRGAIKAPPNPFRVTLKGLEGSTPGGLDLLHLKKGHLFTRKGIERTPFKISNPFTGPPPFIRQNINPTLNSINNRPLLKTRKGIGSPLKKGSPKNAWLSNLPAFNGYKYNVSPRGGVPWDSKLQSKNGVNVKYNGPASRDQTHISGGDSNSPRFSYLGPALIRYLLSEFNTLELKLALRQNKENMKQIYQVGSDYLELRLDQSETLGPAIEFYKGKFYLLKRNRKLKIQSKIKKNEWLDKLFSDAERYPNFIARQFTRNRKKLNLLIRSQKLIKKLIHKSSDPKLMTLTVLPVLPPELRPIVKMDGQVAAADLNRLYQRIIYRNDRLKKLLNNSVMRQSDLMHLGVRLLQESVDNLISNGKSGVTPEKDSRDRLLKSLSDILKGKEGRFRQYLLGKRVDYSGRSVIVVGPSLQLHECGIPKEMAFELFLPFLLKTILNQKLARTVIGAKKLLKKHPALAWELLQETMETSPVLLNRAPTLHRLGIQAFKPKLIEGKAILLHPLVCSAFNADFDGDQMAVHIPLTVEARAEAWKLMLSINNLLSPATGEPLAIPSQDMVLGCYYLTTNCNEHYIKYQKGSGLYFTNFIDVLKSYENKKLDLHAIIWLKWNGYFENGNDQNEPLEIRINSYGNYQEIYPKFQRHYSKNNVLINQYVATTPGKVLFNFMVKKTLKI